MGVTYRSWLGVNGGLSPTFAVFYGETCSQSLDIQIDIDKGYRCFLSSSRF